VHEALHGGLHRAQQQCRRLHAHHRQRATGLVQLLARNAQCSGIERRQV